jgi:hypothetical protein
LALLSLALNSGPSVTLYYLSCPDNGIENDGAREGGGGREEKGGSVLFCSHLKQIHARKLTAIVCPLGLTVQ